MTISIPNTEFDNRYVSHEMHFHFHYFFMRKFWFVYLAKAVVLFPGGFGTLDELFELLTLQQTGKTPVSPVVLFDKAYWTNLINFQALIDDGMIRAEDMNLVSFAETAEEAWSALVARGLRDHAPPTHHR